MAKLINLTPHPIKIVNPDSKEVLLTFEKCENPPRLKQEDKYLGIFDYGAVGIRITKTIFGEPKDMPEEETGVFYIVSRLLKQALPNRNDLFVPGGVIRDEEGQIIGCSGLSE